MSRLLTANVCLCFCFPLALVALQLCHLRGNGLRPQCNEGCRTMADTLCCHSSFSRVCIHGDPSRSISLAWPKHCTLSTPFGITQTLPSLCRCRSKQEACFTHLQAFWAYHGASRGLGYTYPHSHTPYLDMCWARLASQWGSVGISSHLQPSGTR